MTAALIVEVLNAYRKKAKLPDNIGEFTIPLGVPEVMRPGADVTVVTYGACCAIAQEAAEQLQTHWRSRSRLIDVRTLLPFDLHGVILESLKKTNRILFLDEDCPGGATAYMMQKVIEEQSGYPMARLRATHTRGQGAPARLWIGRRLFFQTEPRADNRNGLRR